MMVLVMDLGSGDSTLAKGIFKHTEMTIRRSRMANRDSTDCVLAKFDTLLSVGTVLLDRSMKSWKLSSVI